ncbi:uncharacterized protein LOC127718231 [Mytilus californianus]|uniref:uncharacterized protein LOC127718231 n=1 Tax=Mytilus californianus TaxID=6549 RepID=UPI002246DEA9|nr:uncharacterized protein LOC127718231 [Mytilus californianus]XP_052080177.1 uncharacterized protein LOC127718231 [Mytilus californianus]
MGRWISMGQTMTDSLKIVLFFTILLSQLHSIATVSKRKNRKATIQSQVSVRDFTPQLVTPIFEVMRRYGEAERDEVNKKIQNRNKKTPIFNQYLLITIVSDEEINQAESWGKSFPKEFLEKRRIVFLLNERDHGKEYYNPDRELHGEIKAIHFGEIDRLMGDFKRDPKTKYKYPIMLLYSHYIPCAHVQNLGYSCSEELMNYAKGRIHEFTMLVAYTTVFKNTDEKSSFDFMRNGGIIAFMRMANGPYVHKLKVYTPNSIDGIKRTFQREAYDCITDFPPSKCCTGNQNNRANITTYFINYLTYECISKSKSTRLFTELSRNQLKICLKKEIDKNIGDDCIQCSRKNPESLRATRALIEFCFDRSIEVSEGLGKPRNNIYDPEWVPCTNCNWNVIYEPPGPKSDKDKLPRVMCANSACSMESLCSFYEQNKSRYSKPFEKWLAKNDTQ